MNLGPPFMHTSMADLKEEGRFTFSDIFAYLADRTYPSGSENNDKRALRKRAAFFKVKETRLFYKGGKFYKIIDS